MNDERRTPSWRWGEGVWPGREDWKESCVKGKEEGCNKGVKKAEEKVTEGERLKKGNKKNST